jgi:AcrR family transcriptional regulator
MTTLQSPSASDPPAPARERILAAARRLFYENGIRATGVDRIIAESGVAKMSFYRNFPSKKDLVLAFLRWRHEFWMDWFTHRVDALRRERPGAGLAVMALALREWFEEPGFRGCAFINAAAETTGDAGEVLRLVQEHKQSLCDYIRTLMPDPADPRAGEAARLALLVIDGAIVRAQITGDAGAAASEAEALLSLLERGAPFPQQEPAASTAGSSGRIR